MVFTEVAAYAAWLCVQAQYWSVHSSTLVNTFDFQDLYGKPFQIARRILLALSFNWFITSSTNFDRPLE
jgi:hypothetical protein